MRSLIASGLFFFMLSADAQVLSPQPYDRRDDRDPYYRNDRDPYYNADSRDRRRDNYGYGRRSRNGYGDPLAVADRVMSDVRRVSSNNYMEKRDRKHLDKVEKGLAKFTQKYREGKFDEGKLNDAANSLNDLVRSSSIRNQRDRRVLQDALASIDDLRSGRYDRNARSRSNGSVWDRLGGR
jgi:hypothetical protein